MKDHKKQYWNGLEQLTNDAEFARYLDKEFAQELPVNEKSTSAASGSRRDFLKMMGFSVAAASLAACEAPVRKAIPYLNKPVDIDPGIPNYYASTYTEAGDYCSILVKTREGRPIKIQGNDLSPVTRGGTSARVEASILSLYDKERLEGPMKAGKQSEWSIVDKEIIEKLESVRTKGGAIRIVSNSILSPSTEEVIAGFIEKYPSARHVSYDTMTLSGVMDANSKTFGLRAVPSYHFDRAEVIVSFGADFLGTWLNPIGFSRAYAEKRKLNKDNRVMSRHYQFESLLSLTGANADYRVPIKPSQEGLIVARLFNLIAAKSGNETLSTADPGEVPFLTKAADQLWQARGESLVVSGSNDPHVQMMINGINQMLANYGKTLDLSNPVYFRKGDDAAMSRFVDDLIAGKVDAVIFLNANPVYNHPRGAEIANALKETELVVSTTDRMDETTELAGYVTPDHHYLESWNDAEPVMGRLSLSQPAITPLFNTRQLQESLLTWAGMENIDYFEFLKNRWEKNYFGLQDKINDFQRFWDQSLHDGVFQHESENLSPESFTFPADVVTRGIGRKYTDSSEGFELILYHKVGIGDGSHANIPWLQEMPDPITKTTWDNYITISQSDAQSLGIQTEGSDFSMAKITVGDVAMEAPVLIQPGQAKGTLGIALGYGRKKAGIVANGLGIDVTPLIREVEGFWSFNITAGVNLEPTGKTYQIGQTQTHHTYMSRTNVVQEAYLPEYQADPRAGREYPKIHVSPSLEEKLGDEEKDGVVDPYAITLWKGHDYNNHHWGMIIDLNSCTGCGACTIACQAENNVPVVGKEEVLNRRDMHWIRIDRYYSSNAPVEDWVGLEKAAENPEVTFQPMMCQHCNNAPCETVCPVSATTHSTEGLNQMTYNRCIGTRYCANNCPYKVRRFNWFKYHDNDQFSKNTSMNNDLGKMVLNPDVTVRSRGVMEKCSFCIQRIQYGKLEAKKEGRRPRDGEITSACAEACPTRAIVFGDLNDKDSQISQRLRISEKNGEKHVREERAYHILEEVGTRPNVFYLTKIRNKDIEDKKA